MKLSNLLILLLSISLFLVSCGDEDPVTVETNTIVDIASGDSQFSTLVSALQQDASKNKSDVILTDVQATNGVIHVLQSVIIPTL